MLLMLLMLLMWAPLCSADLSKTYSYSGRICGAVLPDCLAWPPA